MERKIEITRELIEKGTREDPLHCPVATAIRDHIKPGYVAKVYQNSVEITEHGTFPILCEIWFPPSAAEFIRAYDDGEPQSEPFSFSINIPDEYANH